MRQKKRGFTIVELVIVLAVIGILSAVLIPTFSNLVKQSKMSVDQQAVRQMNTILATEAVDGKIDSVEKVREILTKAGINTENYVPLTIGTAFAWVKKTGEIVQVSIVEDNGSTVYVNVNSTDESFTSNEIDFLLKAEEIVDPNRIDPADKPIATVLTGNHSGIEVNFVKDEGDCSLFSFAPEHDLNGENANDPNLVASAEKYSGWIADFAIILNDDFSEGTVGICGSYFGIAWQTIELFEDASVGTTYFLMDAYEGYTITYETLLDFCRSDSNNERDYFNCGTYNLDRGNIGKSITVELRLYQPSEENEYVKSEKYLVCNSVTVTFNSVAEK